MMNERQKLLAKLALTFMLSNIGDVEEVFQVESDDPNHPAYGKDDMLEFNGEIIDMPTEQEIEELLSIL